MPIMNHETTFAGTVQGTNEALALGLPELRYGGAVSVAIVNHFSVTAEYLHDLDYDVAKDGTGNRGHTATLARRGVLIACRLVLVMNRRQVSPFNRSYL